jgi:hypothetical protein
MNEDVTDKADAKDNSQGSDQEATETSKKGASEKIRTAKKKPVKKKRTKKPAKKAGGPGGAGPRPFPAETLQESKRIPQLIRELNGGNPWPPAQVASALGIASKSNRMWYLSASSRDYGFTTGTRDTDLIALDTLGHSLVYAPTPEEERQALKTAFFNIPVFKSVYEYYKGSNLPDLKYLQNTLESIFKVPPQYHEDFVRIYSDNCKYLESHGIEAEDLNEQSKQPTPQKPHSIVVGEPKSKASPVAFVIMPFVEKTDKYSKGFFDEVLKNLITPAAVNAGFRVETAKREGSDVIHSTIVNDLLEADLVIADLTDHNPNVLFELGLRMASEKPITLIRAKGTAAIFDVDSLLRVLDYDSNLWKSTIETDVPKITSHIKGSWDNKEANMSYMQILKRRE